MAKLLPAPLDKLSLPYIAAVGYPRGFLAAAVVVAYNCYFVLLSAIWGISFYLQRMSKHTEDDIAEFQETFHLFDTRGDGKIAASQLPEVLRALSQNPTEQEIRKCGFSQNPDARISFETFYPILQTICKNRTMATHDDYVEGFRVFDKDQNGLIGSADLRHVLTSLGEKMTDDEVTELLVGQEDSQGNVQYEEFIKMVMSG